MSLRGMPKASEAILNGLASTIIPGNDNDHGYTWGSVLLEAMPPWIALQIAPLRFAMPRNDMRRLSWFAIHIKRMYY